MPANTTNYSFKKPYYTDNADINILNENFDTLDNELTPTVSQGVSPPTTNQKGKVSLIINWIANRIKAITGKTNWWDTPATTLESCYNHINGGTHANATIGLNGFMSYLDKQKLDNATPNYTADRLMLRDSSGKAQVQNPSSGYDIVNKAYGDSTYVPKGTATTMSAMLTAQSNTSYTTKQVRNIVLWTSGDTPPSSSYGDIVIKTF